MKIEKLTKSVSLLFLGCASSIISVQEGFAQQANTGERRKNILIEEVIVTASKREENLKDVPISIQAFSGDQLEVLGVTNTAELPRITPGLVLTETLGFVSTFIRGLGTDAFVFADPSVTIYNDGIYNPSPSSVTQAFGVVERIEVLKGPQGTLYGRNAIGGSVNIITKKPSYEKVEAEISLSYEDYGPFRGKAYASLPVTDNFAVALTGLYLDLPHHVEDGRQNGKPLSDTEQEGYRIRALWNPLERLEIDLAASKIESNGIGGAYAVNTRPSPLAQAAGVQAQNPYGGSFNEPDPGVGFEEESFHFRLAYNADAFDIKLLGSSQETEATTYLDFDGSDIPIVYFDVKPYITEAKTLEFQVLSNDSSWHADRLEWILGAYYFEGTSGYIDGTLRAAGTQLGESASLLGIQLPQGLQNLFAFANDLGLPIPAGTLGYAGLLDTDSVSYFAQATYDLTDWVALTLGGRYQEETREIAKSVAFLRNIDGSKTTIPGQDFNCASDEQWCQTNIEFSPKVGLDFRLWEDGLIYLSYQEATKSGTFNSINIYDQPEKVEPEGIKAWEIGVKTTLFGGLTSLDAAAFYYELTNLQTQFVSLLAGGAITFENAAAAKVEGAEFNILTPLFPDLVDDLVLNVGAVYLDAKYTDFKNGSGFDDAGFFTQNNDYSGNTIVRSPKTSATASLNKTFLIPGGAIELGANYYYNSGYFFLAQNKPGDKQGEYDLLGIQATWAYDPMNFRLTFFGNNVLDEKYNYSRFSEDFGTLDATAPLSVYGVRVNWKL